MAYGYDLASNRTMRDERVAMPAGIERDELYTYDGLNRLINLERGKITGVSNLQITTTDRLQTEKWNLDQLGNWNTYQFDGDGDELYTSSADLNDSRSFNVANEITNWDPAPADSTNQPVAPSYDRAGNITDDGEGMVFTYDAWNRLVKSARLVGQASTTLGTYAYDGLGRRIKHNVGGVVGNDQYEYYTKSWQRIEVRPNGEASKVGVSMFVFGIRYVDDIILRVRDANASGPPEERRYYLTDANYNVVMRVDPPPPWVEVLVGTVMLSF